MHPVAVKAAHCGDSAVEILRSIRNRTGGWFDCECGDCITYGDDFHAWEAFERESADAIHYACLYLGERDFAARMPDEGASAALAVVLHAIRAADKASGTNPTGADSVETALHTLITGHAWTPDDVDRPYAAFNLERTDK